MDQTNMSIEKRVHPRISVKIPVKYRLVEDQAEIVSVEDWRKNEKHTHAMNLSLDGMFITVDHPILLGSFLRFDISIPNHAKPLTVFAEVVWANEAGAGLRFLMIKNEDMESLEAFLKNASS